jgi:uncharacterized protein (DUF433 family)
VLDRREILGAVAEDQVLSGIGRRVRLEDMRDLIEANLAVMMGKPVIRGTRITVELILEKLAAGETIDQILEAYPRLTREAALAAIEFGARALRADIVYPLPAA